MPAPQGYKRSNVLALPSRPPQAIERVTPQSLDAEQSALGAMLMERTSVATAVELIRRDDFSREMHRKIFDAIASLFGSDAVIDPVTVTEELRRRHQLEEVGGPSYLTACIETCPGFGNVQAYCQDMIQAKIDRVAIEVSEILASGAYARQGAASINSAVAILQDVVARGKGGQPPQTITAAELAGMEFAPMRWVVPDLIPQGLNILGGMMKQGKSWFAFSLAIAATSGGYFLGSIKVEAGEALYLALEDPLRRLQNRMAQLLQGQAPPSGLHLQREWRLAHQGGLGDIDRFLNHHPDTRLVVIDVLQKFRPARKNGGDLYGEDYDILSSIKDLADAHNTSIFVLHHMSKREVDDPFLALSGSTGIGGAADGLFALERKRGKDEAILHYTGREVEAGRKALLWDKSIFSWALLGDAEELEEQSVESLMLQTLLSSDEPMSPQGIVLELGHQGHDVKENTVRQTLARMVEGGKARRTMRGRYASTLHTDVEVVCDNVTM